jgi:hypothetical protein
MYESEYGFCTKVGGVGGLLDLAEVGSAAAFCCHLRVPVQYFSFSVSNLVSHLSAGSLQVERV